MPDIYRDGELDVGYPTSDERPHTIGSDDLWQESVVLCWWDHDQGIGGFHRIGHEPHYSGGMSFATSFICTREGVRHRMAERIPLRPHDHEDNVFKFGDRFEARWTGESEWIIREPECEAKLNISDYTPATDLWPRKGNTLSDNIAAAHTECPGRVSGTVTLGGVHYKVKGNAYRDHSWGKRDWSCMDHHTWLAASCGPHDSLGHVNFFDTAGNNVFAALHYSENRLSSGTAVEIHPTMDPITRSLMPGEVVVTLNNARRVRATFKPVDGLSLIHHGYLLTNHVCDLMIDDRPGFLIYETGYRINSDKFPSGLTPVITNGLSRRKA